MPISVDKVYSILNNHLLPIWHQAIFHNNAASWLTHWSCSVKTTQINSWPGRQTLLVHLDRLGCSFYTGCGLWAYTVISRSQLSNSYRINSLGTHCEIVLGWMPGRLTNEMSTLVQVMAWCHQATSHYLSQCWPRSVSPNGVTRPQWVLNWPQFRILIIKPLSKYFL